MRWPPARWPVRDLQLVEWQADPALFSMLAMVAEFESDLIRLRTKEGMKVARAKGRLRGKQPKLTRRVIPEGAW